MAEINHLQVKTEKANVFRTEFLALRKLKNNKHLVITRDYLTWDLFRKWDLGVSSQRAESRVSGAVSFIGKLAVFDFLPAGACMPPAPLDEMVMGRHGPGTPVPCRHGPDKDMFDMIYAFWMFLLKSLYQNTRVISNALFNKKGTKYRLLKCTVAYACMVTHFSKCLSPDIC